ncbi:MAG: N-acetylmuramoyl-L-alanine amidase [Cyanobacteria bacterium J06635_11]
MTSADFEREFLRDLIWAPSPKHASRALKPWQKFKGIMIHATASGAVKTMTRWLTSEDVENTYHFRVFPSGQWIQHVPLSRRANHAGRCYIPDGKGGWVKDFRNMTIGVALDNALTNVRIGTPAKFQYENGYTADGQWQMYPDSQLAGLDRGLTWLLMRYPGLPIFGHDSCAHPLGRRKDPGPLFPWDRYKPAGRRCWRTP